MSNEIVKKEQTAAVTMPEIKNFFGDIESFKSGQRMAAMLAASDMVPDTFKGKIENCVIALEISNRIGANILAVMQNLYIVYGKPAWSSQFLISCVNASRRFTPLRYKMTGVKGTDSWGYIAWAKDTDGEILEAPEVTIAMAKAEGWYSKNGSKWKTMPELMLRYRTATLFARLYAPELTMGIMTENEIIDITPVVTESRKSRFEIPAETAGAELLEVDQLAESLKGSPVTIEELRTHLTTYEIADAEYLANPAKYINAILDKGN